MIGLPQPGIFALGTSAHEFLEFDLRPDVTLPAVIEVLGRLRRPSVSAGGVNIVIGFGSGPVARARTGRDPARPRALPADRAWSAAITRRRPSTTCGCGSAVRPATSCSSTRGRRPARSKRSRSSPRDRPAFVHRDSRDLTGFIDGTANPSTLEAPAAALVPEGGPGAARQPRPGRCAGSTTCGAFDAQPIADQERVFGRTKWDSVEMEPGVKPATAHIARVEIEDDAGEELPIYRRSVPYGTVEEAGLYFVAFSADRARLDRMLGRMFGLDADGLHDRLLDFSRPVTGAVYFAPALHLLAEGADRRARPAPRRDRGRQRSPAGHAAPARRVHDRPERRQPGRRLDRRERCRRRPRCSGSRPRSATPRRPSWRPTGPGSPGRFRVRYFSPLAEVPFCGHATIASGVALERARAGGGPEAPAAPAAPASSCSRRTAVPSALSHRDRPGWPRRGRP